VKFSVFFCKDIFGDVPKVLASKGMKAILNKSNFLEMGILSYLRLVLFLAPPALRLTPHEFPPCLVPARPG